MNNQRCANKHVKRECNRNQQRQGCINPTPCAPTPSPCQTAAEECPCREEVQCQKEEAHVKICGKVTFRGNSCAGATVVIVHGRQVVAECITDREGCFEFKGKVRSYSLRAHKNGKRSRVHTIANPQKCKYECNFVLM